ncbi:MAG: hypothetical protein ACYCW5_00810 [Thermoleophilia bacterium]
MSGAPDSSRPGERERASGAYRLRVLPAGKNDKVVEVSDRMGNIIKYLHSRYSLGNSAERRGVAEIRSDWETLSAREFAGKYHLEEDEAGK